MLEPSTYKKPVKNKKEVEAEVIHSKEVIQVETEADLQTELIHSKEVIQVETEADLQKVSNFV